MENRTSSKNEATTARDLRCPPTLTMLDCCIQDEDWASREEEDDSEHSSKELLILPLNALCATELA